MFVPVVPRQSTSPFAMELGQKISDVIREYRQSHPGMRADEVRDALRIAESNSAEGIATRRILAAAIGGIVLVYVLISLGFGNLKDGRAQGGPPLALFAGIAAVVLAFVLIRLARR